MSIQPETRIQQQVIRWWNLAASSFGLDSRLLWHCPNGGKRGRIEAMIFKSIGVKAGVPDLFLAVPFHTATDRIPGLFIEMKAPAGRIEPSQQEMIELLQRQGYAVTVCWNFDEAVGAITRYLKCGDPLRK